MLPNLAPLCVSICDYALATPLLSIHAKDLDKTFTSMCSSICSPTQDLRPKAPSMSDPRPQPRVIHVGWWRKQPPEPSLSLPPLLFLQRSACLLYFNPSLLPTFHRNLFHAFRTDFARIELGSGGWAIVVFAMGAFGCLICVAQSTVGVVEQWGRFAQIAQPGLHCLNPFAGEWLVGTLSLRVQSLDVRCDTKTKVSNGK